jgi:hypothetical protein
MADKIHVEIGDFTVKNADYAKTLPKTIETAVVKVVNASSKLNTKAKSDAGFFVFGNLATLTVDKNVKAVVKLTVATWPKKKLLAFPSGDAATAATKDVDDDVEAVVEAAAKAAAETAVDYMEKNKPE